MDKARLQVLTRLMQTAVDRGECVGIQAGVVHKGEEVYYGAAGMASLETRRPMGRDALFRMFSSSKCVTGLAAAMCVERGFVSPLAPLSEYLPGFKDQTFWDGKELRPCDRPVYIQDVLSMTSGVCYPGRWNPGDTAIDAETARLHDEIDRGVFTGTVEFANRLGRCPLSFRPGSQWAYGFNADIMGAVIEVATGVRFGAFLRREIFDPLGMKDTGFTLTPAQRARLAVCYDIAPGRAARAVPDVGRRIGLADYDLRTAFESGGAGLVSSMDDWETFMRLLQAGGTLDGRRYISPAGFRYMTAPQLTPEQARTFNWQPCFGQNYGCFNHIKTSPGPTANLCSVGTFGWDGALGTNSFVDPVEKLSLVVLIQNQPPFTARALTWDLRNPVYAAL